MLRAKLGVSCPEKLGIAGSPIVTDKAASSVVPETSETLRFVKSTIEKSFTKENAQSGALLRIEISKNGSKSNQPILLENVKKNLP